MSDPEAPRPRVFSRLLPELLPELLFGPRFGPARLAAGAVITSGAFVSVVIAHVVSGGIERSAATTGSHRRKPTMPLVHRRGLTKA